MNDIRLPKNRLNLNCNLIPENLNFKNYKYEIALFKKENLSIILKEYDKEVLYLNSEIHNNKMSNIEVSGKIVDILKEKNLNKDQTIEECWDILYQISFLLNKI
ncbi:TPA: hypothetical protein NV714_004907 [Escherichia coli]|nr:hypothetical protein [Escherichia coli]